MAGQAAKKAQKAKDKASSQLFPFVVGVSAFYAVVRLWLRYATAQRWHFVAFGVLNAVYFFGYQAAVDGVTAPSGSISEYLFDLFVVCLAAQAFAAFFDRAWLLLLVVPAYLLYKASSYLGGGGRPKPAAPEGADDAQEGAAGKKTKQKFKRVRR
mmetsp:Transcript_25102/g.77468  ORF Transcript_25102/g.77468 Transcript_25102/m.77468 type:complete len:155 (-) Transcript_25102:8-472(-)